MTDSKVPRYHRSYVAYHTALGVDGSQLWCHAPDVAQLEADLERLTRERDALWEALERVVEELTPVVRSFAGEDMADVPTYTEQALGIAKMALSGWYKEASN